METRHLSVRLPAVLLDAAEEYARRRRWPRSTVVRVALEELLEDVRGGVPDEPVARSSPRALVVGRPVRAVSAEGAGKPLRSEFESGEEWQEAVRRWRDG